MQEWRGVDPETGLDTWTTADLAALLPITTRLAADLGTSPYAPAGSFV